MLTNKPIVNEQYDECLQLMQKEVGDYFVYTPELAQAFRTIGQVYGIYQEEAFAGFYWIEEREKILYLNGLVLKSAFQGKGIGTQVLIMLADQYASKADVIELRVHKSNAKARHLYEKMGYRTVRYLDNLELYVMQRPLAGRVTIGP